MNLDRWTRHVRLGLTSPTGLLDRSRLAFLGLNVANTAAVLVAIGVAAAANAAVVASIVAVGVLVCAQWWTAHRGRTGVLDDVAVAVAMLSASLALPDATMTVSLIFSAVMFRSLYGSHRSAAVRTAGYIGVYALALVVAETTGRLDTTANSALLLPLPAIVMSAVTMRILFVAVRARDAAAARQTVLTQTATRLLGADDITAMAAIGWEAQRQLLQDERAEPFLLDERDGVFAVVRDVAEQAGQHVALTDVIPALDLAGGQPVLLSDPGPALAALAPHARWWHLVPTGGEAARRVLVLASVDRLSQDTVRSSQLLMHQTALAFDALRHRMELHRQASRDSLTGLANRALFMRELEARSAVSGEAATAVLFLDLDGFKAVNDGYGHAVGDELLTIVAARLDAAVPAGCVVGRLGGDEFAVLVPLSEGDDTAHLLAARLEATILDPAALRSGLVVSVGVSIGVRVVRGQFDADQVLHAADTAMYDVKSLHRRSRLTFA